MLKCIIERENNGFIFKEFNEDKEKEDRRIVFEDAQMTTEAVWAKTDFEEEIVPLQKLFYTIMDYFGVYNSKHERKALDISIIDRNNFPIEDMLKELKTENKDLKKENEDLKCENITLTEKMRYQQQKIIQNTEVLDMAGDLKRDIADMREDNRE